MSGLLMAWALAACLPSVEDTGHGACTHVPPLDYPNFGQAFMDKHCAGCHSSLLPEGRRVGAPVGVDFDTYAAVLQWHERVAARALGDAPTMPPGGGPSDEERALLAEWLACEVARDAALLAEVGASP